MCVVVRLCVYESDSDRRLSRSCSFLFCFSLIICILVSFVLASEWWVEGEREGEQDRRLIFISFFSLHISFSWLQK